MSHTFSRVRQHPRRHPSRAAALLIVCISLLSPFSAFGATQDPLAEYRNPPQVSVITFGPGDPAFFKFGHNAIRVVDPIQKTDLVYNFGTFAFDSPWLIVDFLRGKFTYWLSVSSFRNTLAHYKAQDRTVREQELALGPTAARRVAAELAENALPKNREYVYDYYRDNCSTRVRDVVDRVLGGRFKKRFERQGQFTLREHTLRAVADSLWIYMGLDFAMGSNIDIPETRYSEMFLPEKLSEGLSASTFSGVHGGFSLVKKESVWYEEKVPKRIHRSPPDRTKAFLGVGLALGALLAFLGWEAAHRRLTWARWLLAAITALTGLLAGTLGTLFTGLWVFTNHQVAFRNENILQFAPWAIALPWAAVAIARGDNPKRVALAERLVLGAAGAALLGWLLKATPFGPQDNPRAIALMVPVWIGMAIAVTLLARRAHRDAARPSGEGLGDVAPSSPDDEPTK